MEVSAHETSEAAVQGRVAEGATAEGTDRDSVVAALVAAIDTAADSDALDLVSARSIVVSFGDDGSATVHAIGDAVKLPDLGEGVTVSQDQIKGYLAATDDGEGEPEERESIPPQE